MVNYGKAIGSVIGATMVFDVVGKMTKKGKKVVTKNRKYKPKKKKK
jgi:hypothetical protein